MQGFPLNSDRLAFHLLYSQDEMIDPAFHSASVGPSTLVEMRKLKWADVIVSDTLRWGGVMEGGRESVEEVNNDTATFAKTVSQDLHTDAEAHR